MNNTLRGATPFIGVAAIAALMFFLLLVFKLAGPWQNLSWLWVFAPIWLLVLGTATFLFVCWLMIRSLR